MITMYLQLILKYLMKVYGCGILSDPQLINHVIVDSFSNI